ncbi:hypothetical protein NIASO_19325 [Niabella soli DSM 19437]|uniref:Uncharacterized protein n=1 Tax=Niabella soli DSM 19437 TaxID=929713 RepID=W0F993_9BACT|nr:hypothetical protein NIASO_19325 [Niabella soli DSM 19437]
MIRSFALLNGAIKSLEARMPEKLPLNFLKLTALPAKKCFFIIPFKSICYE